MRKDSTFFDLDICSKDPGTEGTKVSVVLLVYVKDLISNTFLFIPRYHLTDHLAQELDCRQQ